MTGVIKTDANGVVQTDANGVVQTVSSATPQFEVAITGTTSPVAPGDELGVTADVTNTGGAQGTQTITLDINNGAGQVDSTSVTLSAGGSTTQTLSWSVPSGQTEQDYQATVASDDDSATQTVTVGSGVSITVSQQKQQVNPLRRGNFDDSIGHNTVTADISGSNLSTAYVEVSLNGGPYETLQTWGPSDLAELANRSSDGTAISGISVREAGTVRWRDAGRNELQLFYGTNANDGSEVIKKAEGAGPDSVSSPVTVVQDNSFKHQDPTVWYNNDTGQLHLLHEHGLNGSVTDHGEVAVYDAAGLDGESWSNKRLVGDGDGGITETVASPNTFTLNGDHFLLGEEHDSGNFDLLAAKGSSVDSYSQTKIVAQASDYSAVDIHVNLQGPATYTKDGTILAYSNVKYNSDGDYASAPLTTGSFDTDGFPVNWTLGPRTDTTVLALTRFFNSLRVYADEGQNNSSIEYWDLSGSRDERSLGSSPETVSFDIFEPTLFDGDTVSWRVVVEQADGTTTTSPSLSFDITGTPNFGISIDSISPNPASPGDVVDIQTTVTNNGTGTGTQDITLDVAGTQEDIVTGVTLDSGDSTTETLSWATDSDQTEQDYTATVASEDDSAGQTVTVSSGTPDSLVSRWTFDDADTNNGTAIDTVGSNDGTIQGATTGVSGANQTYTTNEGYSFDGSDDSVEVPGTPDFSGGAFTLAVWVRPDDLNSLSNIIGQDELGGGRRNQRLMTNNGGFETRVNVVGSNNTAVIPSSKVSTGNWYHIVGVFNHETDETKIYLDGSLEDTQSADSGAEGLTDIQIGKSDGAPALYEGRVDDARLYSKELTSIEVSNLYANGTITDGPPFFDVTITGTNSPVQPGNTLDVTVDATNRNSSSGTQTITLDINNGVGQVDSASVTLSGGGSTTQTLSWATDSNQTEQDYTAVVSSNDDTASQTVTVGSSTPSVPSPAVNRWVLDDVSSGTVTDSIGTADGSITQANTSVSNAKYQAGAAAESGDGTDYIRTATVSWLSNLSSNFAIAFSMDNYTGSVTDGTRTVGAANNAVNASTPDRFRIQFFDNLAANLQDSSDNLILISADNPTGVADGNLHRVLVNKVANSGAGAFEIYVASSGDSGYTQVSTSVEFDQGYTGNHSWEDDFRIFETSSQTNSTAIDGVIDDVVLYSSDLDSTQRQQDLDAQPSFGQ